MFRKIVVLAFVAALMMLGTVGCKKAPKPAETPKAAQPEQPAKPAPAEPNQPAQQ